MKKYKPIEIFCPKCHRKVGTYDGRSTIDFMARCKTCNKQVVYHIKTKEIEIKPLPLRNRNNGRASY